ncbi:TAKT protein, partial [Acromyrmex heyeri]
MNKRLWAILLLIVGCTATLSSDTSPEYVKQCSKSDPKLITCLIDALHHLRSYLKVGISEIELPSVEPFRNIKKNSYTYVCICAFSSLNHFLFVSINNKCIHICFTSEVKFNLYFIKFNFYSSGVLIILPASGNGTFHARFGDAKVLVRGTVSTKLQENKTYLNVDNLDVVLGVKNLQMRVSKIFNNNRILTEAINLFLRENGQEVLKLMEPQLKKKLSSLFAGIVNQLLRHVPVESFLIP